MFFFVRHVLFVLSPGCGVCVQSMIFFEVSLDASHANKLDWTLDELSESETKTLASWLKHFTHKYPVVGTMREYDSWDFSAVEELAKSQTPFGAPADVAKSKTESATPKTTKAAKASSKKQPAREEEGFKVERGGRYLIKACEDDPSLEGCVGILEDCGNPENNLFGTPAHGGVQYRAVSMSLVVCVVLCCVCPVCGCCVFVLCVRCVCVCGDTDEQGKT